MTGRPVAKARPQLKPAVTLSDMFLLVLETNWTDINTEIFHQDCFAVPKATIRLLRHDPSIPREDGGALRFDDIMENIKAEFDGTSQWPINDWITFFGKGRKTKEKVSILLIPISSKHFLYFSASKGHPGGTLVDPPLQDNVLFPEDFTEYLCHVERASEIHSTIRSGLILEGRTLLRDEQTVFFSAVPIFSQRENLWSSQWDRGSSTWSIQRQFS